MNIPPNKPAIVTCNVFSRVQAKFEAQNEVCHSTSSHQGILPVCLLVLGEIPPYS